MIELVELEKHHADFAKRNTRIIVASNDPLDDAAKTQKDYPHLVVVADAEKKLISAASVLHPKAGQHGEDVAAPTTFIIDSSGTVRWLFRPGEVISRLSVKELLAELDARLPPTSYPANS
ncbi:MAG: redoxin domain-containing protein [Gemmataceae bacterium]